MWIDLVLAVSAPDSGHSGNLLSDLGIVVLGAAVASLIFTRLRLPLIFGYLLVGVLLSPNTTPFSPVSDVATIQELSELGVIFLLFFIGMEFDLARLRAVIGPAFLAVVLQTLGMMYLAQSFAWMLGWTPVESLFLGSLLSISSSMVTIRVLREQGRMQLPHAQLAIGILILEDVLAVLLLVILSGVAVTKQFEWGDAWLVTFLMGVFVTIVFFVGRIVASRVLDRLTELTNVNEQVTLCGIGLVMAISLLAQEFNFSHALGAFVAGAILSQTRIVRQIEHANQSLHDLFSAIFFVTIGMLIDPALLIRNAPWILVVSAFVIVAKIAACWAGLFLAGQPSRSSFRASVAKAQIGEFSFIIAGLGSSLGVMRDSVTSIAFGVAFLTILTTPFQTLKSRELFDAIVRRTPRGVLDFAGFYRRFVETVSTSVERSTILRLIQRPVLQVTVNFFLINGILLAGFFGARFLSSGDVLMGMDPVWALLLVWIACAVLIMPFLIAILRNLNAMAFILLEAVFQSSGSRPLIQGRMRNIFNNVILILLTAGFGLLFLFVAKPYLPGRTDLLILLGLLVLIAVLFWRQMIRLNSRLEAMFIDSFTAEVQAIESQRRDAVLRQIERDYPWAVKLAECEVAHQARVAGQTIRDLGLRARCGASIIALSRGGFETFDPGPDTAVFPGDTLLLFGTEAQINDARQILSAQATTVASGLHDAFEIEPVYLPAGCELDGNTLAGANVRRTYGVNVVGIQRGPEQVTVPPPDFMLRAGDVVYVVGTPVNIERFRNRCESEAEDTPAEAMPG